MTVIKGDFGNNSEELPEEISIDIHVDLRSYGTLDLELSDSLVKHAEVWPLLVENVRNSLISVDESNEQTIPMLEVANQLKNMGVITGDEKVEEESMIDFLIALQLSDPEFWKTIHAQSKEHLHDPEMKELINALSEEDDDE